MSTRRFTAGLALVAVASALSNVAQAQPAFGVDAVLHRIGAPSPESMALFADAGMADVRVHRLSPREEALVGKALRSLPAALARALDAHLDRLSFVDGYAGAGNGLTRQIETGTGSPRYEMTLKAQVLDESLSALLTQKERSLLPAEQRTGLIVRAHGARALRYVLLHEAAHVWEGATDNAPFIGMREGVWAGPRALAAVWAGSLLADNGFRHHPPLSVLQLAEAYHALVRSPFVSLYATASASEDLAETVAWAVLSRSARASMSVRLALTGGRVARFHPLRNPIVRQRMRDVSALLK